MSKACSLPKGINKVVGSYFYMWVDALAWQHIISILVKLLIDSSELRNSNKENLKERYSSIY